MFGQNLSPYERLHVILSDKVMRFNPYSVSDSVLLECAERGYILPPPSFTQMAVFHFHDIQKVERNFSYEAIFFTIGSPPVRYHLAIGSLIHSFTHHHTLRPTHVKIGGKNLTNYRMVKKMQGRSFFVSHIIPAVVHQRPRYVGYRFHLLRGSMQNQADIIRRAMCLGKIEILEEIRSYLSSPFYLGAGSPPDFDTPLWNAIKAVRNFPQSFQPLPDLSQLINMNPFK